MWRSASDFRTIFWNESEAKTLLWAAMDFLTDAEKTGFPKGLN